MIYDDLPVIQCQPGPSDAELQVERDAKHAAAVAEFRAREACGEDWDHIPASGVCG